ncbi:MAG TPA: efflux RND transporter periplasmic adaptor subunit, partial [Paludibacteraceae bacterium]|nr:efflux RND transporter periplasmic adaptor subunit [Paludibacteraceae bacterium]
VKMMRINQSIESIGTGYAKESVDISSNVTEKVTGVFFEDGQYVKEGDVLVQLNDAQYQAELVQAEVELEEQEREFLRISKLSESRSISKKEYTVSQTAVAKAQTVIDMVKYQINNRRIVAPFTGKLGMRNVSMGDLVTPGKTITTIDDVSEIKISFKVAEKYFYKIHNGLQVRLISSAYPGTVFLGRISAVSPRIDPLTRSVSVRALVKNDARKLAPGMLFIVQLNLGKYNAIMIPEKAILSIGEMQYVFVYHKRSQTVKRTQVSLGMRSNGYVEIQKGLKSGQYIVTDGVLKLVDGMQIRLEDDEKEKSEKKETSQKEDNR